MFAETCERKKRQQEKNTEAQAAMLHSSPSLLRYFYYTIFCGEVCCLGVSHNQADYVTTWFDIEAYFYGHAGLCKACQRGVLQPQLDIFLITGYKIPVSIEESGNNGNLVQISSSGFFKTQLRDIHVRQYGKLGVHRVALEILQLQFDGNALLFLLRKEGFLNILFGQLFRSLAVLGREEPAPGLDRITPFSSQGHLYRIKLAIEFHRFRIKSEQIGNLGHGGGCAESFVQVIVVVKVKAPGSV